MPLPEHLERIARDSEITPFKSSGPGGQKKNKTESSVRVKHLPSGITRVATRDRSQMRNREAALLSVWEEIQRRARKPKKRVATKPSRAAVAKRLESKRIVSVRKRVRREVGDE